MVVAPDDVAAAFVSTQELMSTTLSGSWIRRLDGAVVGFSGIPLPTLNGVLVERSDADAAAVVSGLDEIRATGVPYSLHFRPDTAARFADLIAAHGLVASDAVPLMALEDPSALADAQAVEGLSLRALTANEVGLHVEVGAAGFEAPLDLFAALVKPSMLALPGIVAYLGEVGGTPVTTGLHAVVGPAVGIFNIGTPPDYRGRGYGAAVTARAVSDGLTAGAGWAWLQSSPLAVDVYRRLGFSVLETWESFVSM